MIFEGMLTFISLDFNFKSDCRVDVDGYLFESFFKIMSSFKFYFFFFNSSLISQEKGSEICLFFIYRRSFERLSLPVSLFNFIHVFLLVIFDYVIVNFCG